MSEVAEGLSDETLAWLEESEKSLIETEKKIASGEIPQDLINGWTSANWQQKVAMPAPEDIDTDKTLTSK
jgi:hypothetical protein